MVNSALPSKRIFWWLMSASIKVVPTAVNPALIELNGVNLSVEIGRRQGIHVQCMDHHLANQRFSVLLFDRDVLASHAYTPDFPFGKHSPGGNNIVIRASEKVLGVCQLVFAIAFNVHWHALLVDKYLSAQLDNSRVVLLPVGGADFKFLFAFSVFHFTSVIVQSLWGILLFHRSAGTSRPSPASCIQ